MSSATPRFAVPILFAVVFIDLVGFGILMPLVPFYVERLGAGPELITLILAIHPLCQSLATPLWGALSDRFGRRPILLMSMLGHAGAYLVIGFADSLWLLVLSRVLSGVTSANLSTAFAYITDVTTPEQRASALGKVSAAFGLGFATGPAIGGLLAGGTDLASANFERPAIAAAIFSFGAFLAILAFLPESLPKAARRIYAPGEKATPFGDIGRVARRPIITMMLILAIITVTSVSVRESIFPLWGHYRIGLNARELGLVIAYSGGLVSVIQLFGIGPLARRFGELNLVKAALVCFAVSWSLFTIAPGLPVVMVALTVGAFGTAFFQTCMQTLLSKRAGSAERGVVLGVYQSTNAMGRFFGQASAGTLYGQISMNAPFALGAIAMLPALYLATRISNRLQTGPQAGGPAPDS